MKVKGSGLGNGRNFRGFGLADRVRGLARGRQIGSCGAVRGRSAVCRLDSARFRARGVAGGGREIGSASVRLRVGAGDDELKRRTWGLVLPRCLAA
jgi:hypothetical protein